MPNILSSFILLVLRVGCSRQAKEHLNLLALRFAVVVVVVIVVAFIVECC